MAVQLPNGREYVVCPPLSKRSCQLPPKAIGAGTVTLVSGTVTLVSVGTSLWPVPSTPLRTPVPDSVNRTCALSPTPDGGTEVETTVPSAPDRRVACDGLGPGVIVTPTGSSRPRLIGTTVPPGTIR